MDIGSILRIYKRIHFCFKEYLPYFQEINVNLGDRNCAIHLAMDLWRNRGRIQCFQASQIIFKMDQYLLIVPSSKII